MRLSITDLATLSEGKERLVQFLTEHAVSESATFAGKLVLCELVGNILRHSTAFAEVESKIEQGFLELTVRSSDCYLPPETSRCSDVYAEGGRGLFIVDSICHSRTAIKGGVRVLIKL